MREQLVPELSSFTSPVLDWPQAPRSDPDPNSITIDHKSSIFLPIPGIGCIAPRGMLVFDVFYSISHILEAESFSMLRSISF